MSKLLLSFSGICSLLVGFRGLEFCFSTLEAMVCVFFSLGESMVLLAEVNSVPSVSLGAHERCEDDAIELCQKVGSNILLHF